jgi:hypothetical protein
MRVYASAVVSEAGVVSFDVTECLSLPSLKDTTQKRNPHLSIQVTARVSQLASVSDFESGGCMFESCRGLFCSSFILDMVVFWLNS